MASYAAEQKGSLPFGFYWTDTRENDGSSASNGTQGWISWYTILNTQMNARAFPDNTNGRRPNGQPIPSSQLGYRLSKVFQCPAVSDSFQQQVHFYQHGVAMPHLSLEYRFPFVNRNTTPASKMPLDRPAQLGDLYPENILFWDTPLLGAAGSAVGLPFFGIASERGTSSNVLPVTFIDGRQLRTPTISELRFRGRGEDNFASLPLTEFRAMNQTIYYPSDNYIRTQASVVGNTTMNQDIGSGSMPEQLIGNVRFRHGGDKIANVVFADGSVQSMFLNKNRVYPLNNGDESYETTIERRMLLIKWPTGISSSNTFR
jgi:prepilin-type processing-associated H-X9-DG protein